MTSLDIEPLRGQFVVSPEPVHDDDLTQTATFQGLNVAAHPSLDLTYRTDGENTILAIGTLLHPDHPDWTDGLVTDWLVRHLADGSFEAALDSIGGRFVLLVAQGESLHVYGDACGTRSVFHSDAGGTWLASQPGLLARHAGLHPDPRLAELLDRTPTADSWPADLTPTPSVRMLLPNHRKCLRTGRVSRFWPRHHVRSLSLDDAAGVMASTLRGLVDAALNRGRVTVPTTGGYDSRMLLAAAWPRRKEIKTFTVVDAATPSHDVSLPLRLAVAGRLRHRVRHARPLPTSTHEAIRSITGDVWRDPHEHRVLPFRHTKGSRVLLGHGSEISRCASYEHGFAPEVVTPADLAGLTGWADEPRAVAALTRWLDGVPDCGIHPYDLSYWECRVGVWAALDSLVFESFADPLSPFACRRIHVAGLGVEATHRAYPWHLQRKVVELLEPRLSRFPYNATSLTWLKTRIPAPVRRVVYVTRRRISGGSRGYTVLD
ncbi:MAG: hypothetical protein K0S43_68 [Cellulosimicrobium sp.]|nr:hypothetical protein [Cellulosimicrobium sp.]